MAIIDKRRVSDTKVKQGYVVGEVKGRDAVIFEDEIATGGTLLATVNTLQLAGANSVHAGAVHPVLCGPAIERLRQADIESVVVTNTCQLAEHKRIEKITELSVAGLLSEAIKRIHSGESIGALFG
jgi:ribose-phosphate pyrophosphokinase